MATLTGKITLSVDGLGTLSDHGFVQVEKPQGATVRRAFLASASMGISGRMLVNGDVKLNGQEVVWSQSAQAHYPLSCWSHWAEVTDLVKPFIDAAPAGSVDVPVEEVGSLDIDGEILAVVFDDPAKTKDATVILLFGTQNQAGDDFSIGIINPVDLSDPLSRVDLSLGISFGYQDGYFTGQYSTVDVNGIRMTSSAGGEDDGTSANGALLTVGGLDDVHDNPDPGVSALYYRIDDELYDLKPFMQPGDIVINLHTLNPSGDDNVFFAALHVTTAPVVVGEALALSPNSASVQTHSQITILGTVQDAHGTRLPNKSVTFTIVSGPNAGLTAVSQTDAVGQAAFTYQGDLAGTDVTRGEFTNSQGQVQSSENLATIEWTAPPLRVVWDAAGPLPACNPRAQNEAVVGSVRRLVWSLESASTPVSVVSTELQIETAQGTQTIPLPPPTDAGGGRYASLWVVPYNNWQSPRMKLVVETSNGTAESELSPPFSTPTVESLLGPGQIGGVIYEFRDGEIRAAGSGSVYQIPKATLGPLCALNSVPSTGALATVSCDGVFVMNGASLHPCRICTPTDPFDAGLTAHLCLVRDGQLVTTWTQEQSGRVQYAGYEGDRTIQLDRRLGWTTPVAPAVVLEAPSTPDSSMPPLALVNGWTEESDAWDAFAQQFATQGRPAWELYYSSRECEAAQASRLVAQGIHFLRSLLPSWGKVDLLCHSFGAMATRGYLQSVYGGTHYRDDVRRVVFLNGVNHGSHVANDLLRQDFLNRVSRGIADIFKCSDENDPMARDMGIGSDFQSEVQASDLPDLDPAAPRYREYLSIASDKVLCILACVGQWESSMSDGPVSVASASLLDKGVPLLLDGRYSHSRYQASGDEAAAKGILRFFSSNDPDEATLAAALRAEFGASASFFPATKSATVQGEGGISFTYKGSLAGLSPKKAEKKMGLVRVQPLSFGFLNPPARWVRGNVQAYFQTRNGTGNDRYYSWGWCPSSSEASKKNCNTVFFDQGNQSCQPCLVLGDAPSDEDATILPGAYWLEVNGARNTQVVVKPLQYRYEGDLTPTTAAVYAASPVDLLVTDPRGRRVGTDANEIPGATYEQWADSQGEHHTLVRIPMNGSEALTVQVIPVLGGSEPPVYSLFALSGGATDTLALNVPVGDIPAQPYVAQVAPPPPSPAGLACQPGAGSIRLTWQPVDGASGYRVFYGYEHDPQLFSGQSAAEGPSGLDVPGNTTTATLSCLPDSVVVLAVAAVDPHGRQSAWSEEVTCSPLRPSFNVRITPEALNPESNGRYVRCELRLQSPFSISRIDFGSIRIGGTVPVIDEFTHIEFDAATAESLITVKADRQLVEGLFTNGGLQSLIATASYGGCLDVLTVEGQATIRIVRPHVSRPAAGEAVAQGVDYVIQWTLPTEITVDSATVLLSTDGGATWTPLATQSADRATLSWRTPATPHAAALIAVDAFGGGLYLGRGMSAPFDIGPATTDVGADPTMPRAFYMATPRPTPFSSSTSVRYGVPKAAHVRIQVLDVNGRLIATLVDGLEAPGNKTVTWNGTTRSNLTVGSGIYVIRMQAAGIEVVQRAVLLR